MTHETTFMFKVVIAFSYRKANNSVDFAASEIDAKGHQNMLWLRQRDLYERQKIS